jgi:hypothetical protein
MTDQIRIPHRGRDEPLTSVASNCRHLPAPERDVARQIVFDGLAAGERTAAELLDRLAAIEPVDRRRLLDAARIEAGQATTDTLAARARQEAATKAGTQRARDDSPWRLCAGRQADGTPCNSLPTNSLGIPVPVSVRKWFCSEHAGQAQAGDMEAPPSPFRIAPGGAIIEVDPADEARAIALAESTARQEQARLDTAAADAGLMRERDAAVAAQTNRELPAHLRVA